VFTLEDECRNSSIHGSGASAEAAKASERARQPPWKDEGCRRRRIAWLVLQISGNGDRRMLPVWKAGPRKLHGLTSPCTEIEQTCCPAPQVSLVWTWAATASRVVGLNGSRPRSSCPCASMPASSASASLYCPKVGI